MTIRTVADDLYIIPGLVNIYVLNTAEGMAIVDTGFPNSAPKILEGLRRLGKSAGDVRHIVLTHAHPDHIGSAAALKRATGAMVWAHPTDAPIIEAGTGFRPVRASPGLRNKLLTSLLMGLVRSVEPTKVDRFLEDGQSPSFAPDLTVIHSPGHCAGQIALLWNRHGGVLFTADTCVNIGSIKLPVAVEDLSLARESLRRLCQYTFKTICFMHGRPITSGGEEAFRRIWAK